MTASTRIPCVLMRGGTSRGPFFLSADLPIAPADRDAVLIAAMGAGHELQLDGIGGGNPLTSKVAIVGPTTRDGADVDYLFAQVKVRERAVDTSPNCGNMLSAVAPFAIEAGLVAPRDGVTTVRIHNVNTSKIIEARVATPGSVVTYDGQARIDGVPGTAAPVQLAFRDAAGSKTGALLPTGAARDIIDGITVTCLDAAVPMVLVTAADLGKTGAETPDALDSDAAFLGRLERIRIEAGRRMGLGDVSGLVIPKPVLLGTPRRCGTIAARYFMPHACHKALAVTGAVGIATACATSGTVAHDIAGDAALPRTVGIEHPAGQVDVGLEPQPGSATPVALLVRTARRLFDGYVHVRLAA